MIRAASVLAVLLAALQSGVAPAGAPSFACAMDAYLADYAREYPVDADGLGIQTYADKLEDVSAKGHDADVAWQKAWRARIVATALPSDGPDVQADRRAMLDAIDAQLVEDELLAPWRTDPQVYLGLLGQSVFLQLVRE